MTVLEELEGAIQTAAERTGPKVIGLGQGWGRGSGVVIESGRILTNAHNLRGEEVTVVFADGRRETGRVLATDQDLDLAVIEADTADIEPIEWAEDAEAAPLGRSVLALANPGGRGLRVTPGFVSATARSFRPTAARLVWRTADRRRRAPARDQRDSGRRRADPGDPGRSGDARACRPARTWRVAQACPARRGDRPAAGGAAPASRGWPARARRRARAGGRARQRRGPCRSRAR